ncbi:hypothetical protein DITRI_Ditri04bG0168300 [Diplodiscus trichospermus]
MDYRTGSAYDAQIPMYRQQPTSSSSSGQPIYGTSLYPRIGQPAHSVVPPPPRTSSFHQTSSPSFSSGLGIRVALKPEYRILLRLSCRPKLGIFLEAISNKGSMNWSRLGLENFPSKRTESTSSPVRYSYCRCTFRLPL